MNWEADILESTYYDTMTIFSESQTLSEIGILENAGITEIYSNIKCALSKKDVDYSKDDISTKYIIFCKPDIIVKAKDRAIIKTNYGDYEGEFGVPFYYPSHIEIPFLRLERI